MSLKLSITPELFKAIKSKAKSKVIKSEDYGWRGMNVTTNQLVDDDIQLILDTIENDTGGKNDRGEPRGPLKDDIKNRRVVRNLNAYLKLKETGADNAEVKKLELLPEAIRGVLGKTEHKRIYKPNAAYGWMMPWFVQRVVYHPKENKGGGYVVPAHVDMTLAAFRRGKKVSETVTWHAHDLYGGKTVRDVFAEDDILIESPEINTEYDKDLENYKKYAPQLGEQFIGQGDAVYSHDHRDEGYGDTLQLEVDGVKAKLVMDSTSTEKDDNNLVSTTFWAGIEEEDEEDVEVGEEDEDPNTWEAPTHPICRLFHLEKHAYILCYVANLKPYVYDSELINKLVLPAGTKELIDALTMSVVEKMDDIIAGKASGVMILCSGSPGTGKTLTAEVYAETAERPLYSVQCSQLGTNEEEIEKHLIKVLKRAVRWRAILLIDESDVYIHERGKDIQQNAIVGTFLRALEYFSGIMFLTTNRATVVDDAIMSRMTAHVKYNVPEGDARNSIWAILSKNFGVEMSKELINEAVEAWPNISGRSIRQMIRLAKFMADHRKQKVTLKTLQDAAQFHDFDEAVPNAAV